MKEDFNMEKANIDYRTVKDELYLLDQDRYDQEALKLQDDVVK